MSQSRIMHVKKPCPVNENDEVFRNGVFILIYLEYWKTFIVGN
ncbi:hypothetical protein [Bacillus massilinigeriensis]|nr:hypothetical protein [Bacillus massilionigeriensis]